jgi:hypothetical protein
VTIEQACRQQGVDLQQFIETLNAVRPGRPAGRISLPVV